MPGLLNRPMPQDLDEFQEVPAAPAWQRDSAFRESNATRAGGFDVVTTSLALKAIRAHAKSGGRNEIIGLLLGKVFHDAVGHYLLIEHAVAAPSDKESRAQVTMTADAWASALSTIDRDHPGATIVGWYHSHPGHGVFLSEPDLFVHRSFFDLPWQTAVVIDPTTGQCDAFHFDDAGRLVQRPMGCEINDPSTVSSRSSRRLPIAVEATVWFIGAYALASLVLRLGRFFDTP